MIADPALGNPALRGPGLCVSAARAPLSLLWPVEGRTARSLQLLALALEHASPASVESTEASIPRKRALGVTPGAVFGDEEWW